MVGARSSLMRVALLAGIVAALLPISVQVAHACARAEPVGGRVTELKVSSYVVDDPESAKACDEPPTDCGVRPRYRGAKGILVVYTIIDERADGGSGDHLIEPGKATYVLKDAAGAVLEEQTASTNGATFNRAGATVCIKTKSGELCVPTNVASLEVTERDRIKHDEDTSRACGPLVSTEKALTEAKTETPAPTSPASPPAAALEATGEARTSEPTHETTSGCALAPTGTTTPPFAALLLALAYVGRCWAMSRRLPSGSATTKARRPWS